MHQAKPSTFQSILRWSVPIAALVAIAAWIYIAPPGLLGMLSAIGYAVCHRLDSHSLHIGSLQLPLCARCTGEFNAAAIGLLFQALIAPGASRLPRRSIQVLLGLLFLAFAFDGSNSYLALMKTTYPGTFQNIPNLYLTDNTTRVFTGTGMGLVMSTLLYPLYNQSLWRSPKEERALGWGRFGILAGILLVLDLGMLSGSALILYPVAVVSSLGVLALLTMVFSIVWIMVMRQDNIFERLGQLWLPALAGLTLAFLLILSIDLLRFSVTHTWGGFPGLSG